MSNKNDKLDADPDAESLAPLCGERLAHARREQKIPIHDIAKELHLDEYKVRALEANEFDVIGAPVFAKGHLRKYAQLLKVDTAEMMSDYYELTRLQASAPALSVRPKPRQAISPGPWLMAIALLAAIATAYWWFFVRVDDVSEPVIGVVTPLPQSEPMLPEDVTAGEVLVADADAGIDLPPTVDDSDVVGEVATGAAIDATQMRLSIIYAGDSWTEISDANGRRLFFDLGKAGRTVDLSGDAPFNVLFGDAANVSLVVNGASYQLPSADRRGTVRVTITSP